MWVTELIVHPVKAAAGLSEWAHAALPPANLPPTPQGSSPEFPEASLCLGNKACFGSVTGIDGGQGSQGGGGI